MPCWYAISYTTVAVGKSRPGRAPSWKTPISKTKAREKVQKEKSRGPHWSLLGVCERVHQRARYRRPICYRTAIYHRRTVCADPTPDMDIRNLFSKLKKKVKRLGNKQKLGRTGADVDGESANPTNPPPRPGPHVVVDGGGGKGADVDGQQASSTDQPPQPNDPEPVPANMVETDQGGGEADTDGKKVSPMYLPPHSDVEPEVGVGSGYCRDGNRADGGEGGEFYSHSSTPSIPHCGEEDEQPYSRSYTPSIPQSEEEGDRFYFHSYTPLIPHGGEEDEQLYPRSYNPSIPHSGGEDGGFHSRSYTPSVSRGGEGSERPYPRSYTPSIPRSGEEDGQLYPRSYTPSIPQSVEEGEQFCSRSYPPSVLYSWESNGMLTWLHGCLSCFPHHSLRQLRHYCS